MTNEWRTVKLGDFLTLQRGFDLPKHTRAEGRIPVVSSSGISGTHNEAKVQPPGVVTGRYGTIGQVYFLRQPFWPLNTTLWVKDFKGNDEHFCYYLLQTVDYFSCSDKAAVPGVNRNHLHELAIAVPPITEQRAIAQVLGTLDDKIECNRQMNRSLEDIVRALFKSWFIDFDPVIDNALAAGNQIPDELADRAALRQQVAEESAKPLPDELRALFPAEFICTDSMGASGAATAGRWIPKGWEVAPLSALARLNPHSWTTKNAPKRIQYIDLANTKNGRITEVVEYSFDTAPSRARRILYSGDTVFGTVRPGNRSFAYIHEEGLTGSTGFAVLQPLREAYREFVYLATTRDEMVDLFAHLADGAAYPAVRAEVIIEQVHAMPPTQIIEAFHHLVAAVTVSIGQRSAQNTKLSALRDTLLPQLLSGELRVPVAAPQTVGNRSLIDTSRAGGLFQ
ncbi:MAG: restriction endonuclease subunit S [Lentisphaerae bacterium]|nr:restriction endonuclease subunit S [Lentisphaerota bacterium]